MELIERDHFLATLNNRFSQTAAGTGHCCFITGEAGIGKTSLVQAFLKGVKKDCLEYQGLCDSLFTPRPLAPLYDVALQMKDDWTEKIHSISSRSELFTNFLQALSLKNLPIVLVFEDIHWAGEATLDFIKFLSRRISHIPCLFILTYRDNDFDKMHPMANIIGDLVPGTFSLFMLTPLSKPAVQKMAEEKGFDGEDVFSLTGGIPFYVNEILADRSTRVPDNVRNLILSIYNRQEEQTKIIWQLLSVIPEGLELTRLPTLNPSWIREIEKSLSQKNLIIRENKIFFKHELFRRTVEGSLSHFKRIELNKLILELYLKIFEKEKEVERIVHYAKNANENELVIQYAPVAAKQAACVGSHIEASKLYLTVIQYSTKKEAGELATFYEDYAYECYLTNQIKNAIIYQEKALKKRKEKNEIEETANNLRLLSRFWWFEGDRKKAESFGEEAIEILEKQSTSKTKAMAYSNMAQLKSSLDKTDECIFWGEKAIAIAREIKDEEILSETLNNMGSTLLLNPTTKEKGLALLQQSLSIALRNSYHEYVGRAYLNLGTNGVTLKDYVFAKKFLEKGIQYCEERDMDSMKLYMLVSMSRLHLDTGNWPEAYYIADNLLKKENLPAIIKIGALIVIGTIKIRRCDQDALPLLMEAKMMAFKTTELQRIAPVFLALLEYEWISGISYFENKVLSDTVDRMIELRKFSKKSKLYFWLRKTGKSCLILQGEPAYKESSLKEMSPEEIEYWQNIDAPYEKALILSEGNEEQKRKALSILGQFGADAVCKKIKLEMRASGITKISRGLRESTKTNPAQLTNRELDILALVKEGFQNKEIAGHLFISPKTVDHHISSILFKLDVNSRTKAVAEAAKLEILK